MDVVHVYDGHEKVFQGRGSVPNVVWNIAKHTFDRGHSVTVLERDWNDLSEVATHDGVKFRRLSLATGSDEPYDQIPYEMISSPVGVAKLLIDRTNFGIKALLALRELDFDLVHVHLPFAANVLVTVAPRLRKQMVYTAHLGETTKRVLEPRISPDVHLAKRVARTIALNPRMHSAFEQRGVSGDRLVTIPNGVDIQRFEDVDEQMRRTVVERYGLDGRNVVLFVGTVTPRKGVRELLQAATEIAPTHRNNTRFVIVGKTDMELKYVDEVRDVVEREGLADAVTMTGFVPEAELRALYDIADVFVLPSFEEGSSIAIMEAIAAGLPVVGSRIDGIKQQIDDGTHGILIEPGDISQLAASIERLLGDSEQRESMRTAVEERARELSWDRVTADIVSVYRDVITE